MEIILIHYLAPSLLYIELYNVHSIFFRKRSKEAENLVTTAKKGETPKNRYLDFKLSVLQYLLQASIFYPPKMYALFLYFFLLKFAF